MAEQIVPKPVAQPAAYAARYRAGEPFDDVAEVALKENSEALVIEDRACSWLLVAADIPESLIVRDGQWLVWPGHGFLRVLDDDDFRERYNLAPLPGLVEAVASVIGALMITRHSTVRIAEAVLAGIADYWETCVEQEIIPATATRPAATIPLPCEECVQLRSARTNLELRHLAHWQGHASAGM